MSMSERAQHIIALLLDSDFWSDLEAIIDYIPEDWRKPNETPLEAWTRMVAMPIEHIIELCGEIDEEWRERWGL